jgi:hypothetical protein
MFGRFFVAATTADCGLSDEESARILSTPDSDFGDEETDHPPPTKHSDVHCPGSIDEVLDYYDQHQPFYPLDINTPDRGK